MNTGVYRISDILDCKEYIGSAAQGLKKRWKEHLRLLRLGKHHSWLLQKAWNAYGELFFTFDILEECPPEKCIEREQWWMDREKPEYNICKVAGSQLGNIQSPESRAKNRTSNLGTKNHFFGKHHTLEARAIMSAKAYGRKISPETHAKLCALRIGKKPNLGHRHTPEWRMKMSKIMSGRPPTFLGHKHTPEARAKVSASLLGNTRTLGYKHTPETLAKIRASLLGNKYNLGHTLTPERRSKISAASRLWWQKHRLQPHPNPTP